MKLKKERHLQDMHLLNASNRFNLQNKADEQTN